MTTATDSPRPDHAQAGSRTRLTRTAAGMLGVITVADGIALVVLAFTGHPGGATRLAEAVFGVAVLVPGLWLVRSGFSRIRLGPLLPDVVLAGALLTLGVAMPAFHRGAVDYQTAVPPPRKWTGQYRGGCRSGRFDEAGWLSWGCLPNSPDLRVG